ncbi:MAG: serine/threonine protein kinase [Ktedonobacteraceae bacterium]
MRTGLRNLGQYKLQTCLRSVGRVEIWKAIDASLRCYVTLKLIHTSPENDPGFLARFIHEAKLLKNLRHPNIVRIHDTRITLPPQSENPLAYIVMEYIDGPTLADVLHNMAQTGKNLSAGDLIYLYDALSSAIDFAHQKGIIHANIQPATILLRKHSQALLGEPALACFGTARLQGTSPNVLCLWGLDVPSYLAPEQCQGKPATAQSDIYALGAILYEIYTGMPPFQGDSSSAIMLQHMQAAPKPPILINPAMPPAVSKIILRCLEKDPERRFVTASAMVSALTDALLPLISNIPAPAIVRTTSSTSLAHVPGSSFRKPVASVTRALNFRSVRSLVTRLVPYAPPQTISQAAEQPTGSQSTWSVNMRPLNVSLVGVRTAANSWKAADSSYRQDMLSHVKQDKALEVFRRPGWDNARLNTLSAPTSSITTSSLSSIGAINTRVDIGKIFRDLSHLPARVRVFLCIVFAILLVCSSLSAYLVKINSPNLPPVSVVGKATFVSSGLIGSNGEQHINDEVMIDLHNLAIPGTGKRYYVWLLSDVSQIRQGWLLLGKMNVSRGNVHVLFAGDRKHSDLLAKASRFLITEEDGQRTENNPFLHQDGWRYFAELPQEHATTGNYHLSILDQIRDLLVQTPELHALGFSGDVNTWMLRKMAEVSGWSIDMRDNWKNARVIRERLSDILCNLDGECAHISISRSMIGAVMTHSKTKTHSSANFPLIKLCMQASGIQLASMSNMRASCSILDSILFHITGMLQSPGVTPSLRMQAEQIKTAINRVKFWLNRLQRDAMVMMRMKDAQLLQPAGAALLGDIVLQARYAYTGQLDPVTGNMLGGIGYIYDSIQRLSTFDVSPYISN